MLAASVVTPSHRPTHLRECWRSLEHQVLREFEWLVAPNGPHIVDVHREAVAIAERPEAKGRVRVLPMPAVPPGCVGAAKRFAFGQARGDLIVELDHDDVLTPNCLVELALARKRTRAGFFYSDWCDWYEDGKPRKYGDASERYGWEYAPFKFEGKSHLQVKAFEPSARSICEIWYAPNHVRAWSRDAYRQAGGHNPALTICDDHDLVCRTWLTGTEFVHIPKALYLQRCHAEQTSGPRHHNAKIQQETVRLRDKYLHQLVVEECRRRDLPMYDLGGAHNCPEGFIPVDKALPDDVEGFRGDVFDLPVEDNSVGAVRMADFVEHLAGEDVIRLLNLLYRKLVPGGWLLTMTPSIDDGFGKVGRGAFQDPTHKSHWSRNNWLYFTARDQARFVPEIACRFQAVRLETGYPSDWHRDNFVPYVWMDACALKEGRHPGPCHI